ncbi:MAG: helix-turn-helix domain-containing protein, partial [Deltaproteobacteria bacterium]|nr:helix-turn-helix domain-containing protein [Deltaproteobacteria bacterium]
MSQYETRQPKINSIDKALNILGAFAPYNREPGTIEISRKLGFHKATVSRILQNLTKLQKKIRNT